VVVELTSSRPVSGKTNFLYYVTALAVLPVGHGGQGIAVVWLDTDGRFSATRLQQVMLGVLSASAVEESDTENLIQEALTHVHVFRPQSSPQLIATLDSLPSYLLDVTAHSSIQRRLGLVVLDSATAFYWQDRFYAETARFEHPDEPRDRPSRTAEVITRLKKVQKGFDCAILFSTSSIAPSVNKHAPPSVEGNVAPHEPRSISPWTAFATLTLVLSRLKVPRFAEHMSLEECLGDREKRQEAIAKGSIVAEVDRRVSETWSSSVRIELGRNEAQGSFWVAIAQHVTVA
jgi:Rad51